MTRSARARPYRQIAFRALVLAGVALAVSAAPIPRAHQAGLLAAFVVGLAAGFRLPALDRQAVWLVGPAVLVLALAPPSGVWAVVALAAVAVLGVACDSGAGAERTLPALGLPLFTIAFRTGQAPSGYLLAAWTVTVIALLALADRPGAASRPAPGGPGSARTWSSDGYRAGPAGSWRTTLQGLAVVVLAVPVALAGGAVGVAWTAGLSTGGRDAAGTDDGGGSAGRGAAHPGLSGGLDTGLPVALDDEVVLRVEAPRARYWRGTTYDQWDGRFWTSAARLTPIAWTGGPLELESDLVGSDLVGSDLIRPDPIRPDLLGSEPLGPAGVEIQRFTAVRGGLDVLVGAWSMATVEISPRPGLAGDDGTVALYAPLEAGATWVVTSEVPLAGPEDLRAADPAALPPDSPVLARFAVEDDVTPEVAALARDVTAGVPTTYDRVRALEAWIEENVTYTRAIDPLPPGADAVHHLLFGSRKGYCEQIASALAVMLRSLGVPARVAVGFVPGGWDADAGAWVSRGTDAHAWTEVWFPGIGWYGFDPTAGVPVGAEPPVDGERSGTGRTARARTAGLVGAGGVGALAVAAHLARRLRRHRVGRHRVGAGAGPDPRAEALLQLGSAFDRCGSSLGLDWGPEVTLGERGRALVDAGVSAGPVAAARRTLERAWFGPGGDAEDELRAVLAALAAFDHAAGSAAAPRATEPDRAGSAGLG